jgi:CheY-like chemotaxis protein/DNA-directed RNA polymerase specialized sigma24 family protein
MSSISASILPHLPFLRRFARSLTGRQESGDAYVVALLEGLTHDPKSFRSDVSPRVALYQAFLKTWNAVSVNGTNDMAADGANGRMALADERLARMTPVSRQAFLLVAVEGFSASDAAMVLDVTPAQFDRYMTEANRELAEQVQSTVLIIEDEPLIAIDLESVVMGIGHRVLAIARTQREAVAAFRKHKPGLVLADIQLADGSSGIDAVNEILGDMQVPVVFITAYPEQLLTGKRPEPTFLISKPFQQETLQAVISQALFFDLKAVPRAIVSD